MTGGAWCEVTYEVPCAKTSTNWLANDTCTVDFVKILHESKFTARNTPRGSPIAGDDRGASVLGDRHIGHRTAAGVEIYSGAGETGHGDLVDSLQGASAAQVGQPPSGLISMS